MKIGKPARYLVFILFLMLCCFPLFLHLDSLSLRLWDESRRAVNALEMLQNGDWFVPHFIGQPDMWGVKPPLLVWMQAIFMWIFGYNELAVRLPSALAGMATALLLVWLGHRKLNRPALGYFAALALVTMPGYLEESHSARTGDYDALLTLWLTGGLLFFFSYIQATDRKAQNRYLWLTTGFLILGVWTKGIAGLFFLPGMFIFAFLKDKLPSILKQRETHFALLAFLIIASSYYWIREAVNPGYIATVWDNEIAGRYLKAPAELQEDFWYYFRNLWNTRLGYWKYLIPPGLILGIWKGDKIRSLSILTGLNSLILLLVLSNSQSKYAWYDLPLFPSLAIIASIPVAWAFEQDFKIKVSKSRRRAGLVLLFVIIFLSLPYYKALRKIYAPADEGHQWERMQYAYFMKNNKDLKKYDIGINEYNPHVNFYVEAFNSRGWDLGYYPVNHPPNPGIRILLCDPKFKGRFMRINEEENLKLIRSWGPCELWERKIVEPSTTLRQTEK
jgi:4-amino-4-deoxy-L-arabinose transferase-like glycosyltransferase